MNAMETTHQGTTTAKPQLKQFNVDPKRLAQIFRAFDNPTLTQLRDGINRIIESRKQR